MGERVRKSLLMNKYLGYEGTVGSTVILGDTGLEWSIHSLPGSSATWGSWESSAGSACRCFNRSNPLRKTMNLYILSQTAGSQRVRGLGRGMQETWMRSSFIDLGVVISEKKEVFTNICRSALWAWWWCTFRDGWAGWGGLTMEELGLGHP